MTDPFNERGAAEQLQAANMSMQNRSNMLGQQAGFLGQAGQMLQGQSGLLGQEVDLGTMGFQDAIAQMNQMDQARLAAAGMNFQGQMGAFNAPTGADKLISAIGATGQAMQGAAMMGGSDVSLKKDIKLAKKKDLPTKEEIKEFLGALTPYYYQYKEPEKYGSGERIGVMAQDLEKTKLGKQIVVNTPNGKMVDIWKGVGLALAAQSVQ